MIREEIKKILLDHGVNVISDAMLNELVILIDDVKSEGFDEGWNAAREDY